MLSPDTQVQIQHYEFSKYVDLKRWNSYWHQINLSAEIRPCSVLCVGVGDNVVPNVLESMNIAVTRFDFDENLGADVIGSVSDIDELIGSGTYDVVLCCQVLEHLPYSDFLSTVAKLKKISGRRLVVSLPYRHTNIFSADLVFPKSLRFRWNVELPKFWQRVVFNGEHYWEVGARGFPAAKVFEQMKSIGAFRVMHCRENRYHIFYVLDV